MRRLVIGLSVGATLLAAAGCGGGDKDSSADSGGSPSSSSSADPSTADAPASSGPSSSSSSSAGTSPTGGSASAAAPTAAASGSPGNVAQPCSLLSNADVRAALGAAVSSGAPNSRGQFTGCNYALSGGATLVLYLSVGRGPQIYQATQSGGGFSDVSGVGEAAAYNSEDGRFITRAQQDFVELTLPSGLPGVDGQRAQKAGGQLADRVLAQLH